MCIYLSEFVEQVYYTINNLESFTHWFVNHFS